MKKNDLIKKLLPVLVVISMLLSTAPIAIAAVPEADGTEKVSTEQELRFALSRNSQPKLTGDIKLTSCLVISNRATILLEGKKLYREMSASADDGHVIEVKSGGNLTIKNRTEDESVISGGYATQGGGILNSGTLKIENIKIAENKAKNGGGVLNHGILTANNVSLEGGAPDGTATTVTLTKDCTAVENDTALIIPATKIITLTESASRSAAMLRSRKCPASSRRAYGSTTCGLKRNTACANTAARCSIRIPISAFSIRNLTASQNTKSSPIW